MPKNIIKVENLNLWFKNKKILKDMSMEIAEHEITSIIGPSGCGKSTFIRTLNRMNDLIPTCRITGNIFYENKNIFSPGIDVTNLRRRVGQVFQKPNPFPKSIFENVAFGPRLYGEKNKNKLNSLVKKYLERVGLWEEVKENLNRNALSLSGGQQQRLCIARVLAAEPKVMLMDEPCSALDPISTAKIEDLMQKIKNDVTIVIVTHNMQQAARVSQFTGFFLMGELIEYGKTNDIFTKPRCKKTEDYITGRFG